MYQILALASAGTASGHFWQIRPNPAAAKFLARFLDLGTAAVHGDYSQPKVNETRYSALPSPWRLM